jgi:hydrogenase maturation protease
MPWRRAWHIKGPAPAVKHPPTTGQPLRVLVIGYGNAGRGDDGLGPALAERLESLGLAGVAVETDRQLAIEHAQLAAAHDVVVFADAAIDVEGTAPFYLRRVDPAAGTDYSSHHLSPPTVLQLAAELFGASPIGWLLGIRPVAMDTFAEGLTPQAEANLTVALAALRQALEQGTLAD